MLQRELRLPHYVRFQKAQTIYASFFILKFTANSGKTSRFSFIVSKKLDKRAVVRNRIKRRIRACIENMQKDIVPGFDVLFLIKKEALSESTEHMYKAVKEIFLKEGLVKTENKV